jgi:hypothetical protein
MPPRRTHARSGALHVGTLRHGKLGCGSAQHATSQFSSQLIRDHRRMNTGNDMLAALLIAA